MDFANFIRERLESLKRESRHRLLFRHDPLSFSSNDYLGLSRHPEIVEAGKEALARFGAGSGGSRLLGGHSEMFEEAEERIARAFGAPTSLFFSTGYLANVALLQALGAASDRIFSDELNHASLIDGARLSGAPKRIVSHCQWSRIGSAELLGRPLLVTESLFSMDGDLVPRADIEAVWRAARGSFLVVDEAHAAGVIGESGRGLFGDSGWSEEEWDRGARVITFGKAFGAAGAAVLCSPTTKDWLVNSARGFIYTTAPSPGLVAMAVKGMELALAATHRREELWARATRVREILGRAQAAWGKPLPEAVGPWGKRSPVVPFRIPGNGNVLRFCQNMGQLGLGLRAIRYPTVPVGTERLRLSLTLGVSREETERMAEEVVRQWTAFSSREPILA